jgi:hypothetical protein
MDVYQIYSHRQDQGSLFNGYLDTGIDLDKILNLDAVDMNEYIHLVIYH